MLADYRRPNVFSAFAFRAFHRHSTATPRPTGGRPEVSNTCRSLSPCPQSSSRSSRYQEIHDQAVDAHWQTEERTGSTDDRAASRRASTELSIGESPREGHPKKRESENDLECASHGCHCASAEWERRDFAAARAFAPRLEHRLELEGNPGGFPNRIDQADRAFGWHQCRDPRPRLTWPAAPAAPAKAESSAARVIRA
jgi:hypothetical protein